MQTLAAWWRGRLESKGSCFWMTFARILILMQPPLLTVSSLPTYHLYSISLNPASLVAVFAYMYPLPRSIGSILSPWHNRYQRTNKLKLSADFSATHRPRDNLSFPHPTWCRSLRFISSTHRLAHNNFCTITFCLSYSLLSVYTLLHSHILTAVGNLCERGFFV